MNLPPHVQAAGADTLKAHGRSQHTSKKKRRHLSRGSDLVVSSGQTIEGHYIASSHESDSDEELASHKGRTKDEERVRRRAPHLARSKARREDPSGDPRNHANPVRRIYSGANPSTTSVLTTLTGVSGSTNSTITQESYNRKVTEARLKTLSENALGTNHESQGLSHGSEISLMSGSEHTPISQEEAGDTPENDRDDTDTEGSSSDESEALSSHSPTTQSSGSTFPSSTDAHNSEKLLQFDHESYEAPVLRSERLIRAGSRSSNQPDLDVRSARAGASASPSPSPSPLPAAPDAPHASETVMTGYETIATAITDPSKPGKPIYRKFDELNHRVLLHLQDELAELEESLRYWDRRIALETLIDANGKPLPSSRRAEAWAPTDHPHYQRRYLLGSIYVKTEQYNKALASSVQIDNLMERPHTDSVEAYKTFLKTEECIHKYETQFLNRYDDLIMIPSRKLDNERDNSESMQHWIYHAWKTEHPFLVVLGIGLGLSMLTTWAMMMIMIMRQ